MASEEEPQTTSSTLSFILVNLLVVFALVGFCFLFGLGRIFSDWCGNRVDYEVVSPDKQLKAVQFTRDCGATTSLSSQISILNQGTALPNESGNVFVSEGGIAKVRWINNRKLAIDYYESCQVFHKETSILVPGRFLQAQPVVELEYHLLDSSSPASIHGAVEARQLTQRK